jgi:hypothetical protein
MDCNNLFRQRVTATLLLLGFCLLCSCRKLAPSGNPLTVWQEQWRGVPLTAVSHSEELNLFLPPAPVFFAATKNDTQPTPQVQWWELGPANDALKEYCQAWNEILSRKSMPEMDLPPMFSLPPPPWTTLLSEEDFRETAKFLYSALSQPGLSTDHKKQLELLLVFHEQQQQLAVVLSFISQINHGKECDLNLALSKFRIFREFQQDFAGHLTDYLMPELQAPAQNVDARLRPFLALPQLETPLHCLPSLWMAISEPADDTISAAGKTLSDWRDLAPAPFRFAAIWEDLQTGLQQSAEGFTWLIMSFPSPQAEKNSSFHLLFLPLPEQSEVFLNGVAQPITTNQALAIELKAAESPEDEQLLALRFPNVSLGTPLWPPWLVKSGAP